MKPSREPEHRSDLSCWSKAGGVANGRRRRTESGDRAQRSGGRVTGTLNTACVSLRLPPSLAHRREYAQ
eukprot:scaffold488_cov104-Isochrysis_galbana.AAC.2